MLKLLHEQVPSLSPMEPEIQANKLEWVHNNKFIAIFEYNLEYLKSNWKKHTLWLLIDV